MRFDVGLCTLTEGHTVRLLDLLGLFDSISFCQRVNAIIKQDADSTAQLLGIIKRYLTYRAEAHGSGAAVDCVSVYPRLHAPRSDLQKKIGTADSVEFGRLAVDVRDGLIDLILD